jgi:hypothetical protein
MTNLILQLGGDNVPIEVVNLPGSNWPALYEHRSDGQHKIYINLAMPLPPGGLARTILHEITHHLTMVKLRYGEDRVPLSDIERAAKGELLKIFKDIQGRPEFKGEYGSDNPWEFASEIFSSETLRAKLNAITDPDTKLTIMQRISNAIGRLLYGDQAIQAGSLLEEAMRQTINVAGVRAASDGISSSALQQEERVRLRNLLNEFPQFHDEIINATAPMRADMKITAKKRQPDYTTRGLRQGQAMLETKLIRF